MPIDIKSKTVYDTRESFSNDEKVEYYPEPTSNGDVIQGESDVPVQTKIKISQYMSSWSKGTAKGSTQGVHDKYPKDPVETPTQVDEGTWGISPSVMKQSSNESQFDSDISKQTFGSENRSDISDRIDPKSFLSQKSVEGIRDQYVSAVLTNNKWTADSTQQNDGSISLPRTIGERDSQLSDRETNYETYSSNQVMSVGATLAARASIEKGSGEDGYNVNSAASEMWGILPGWSQLAVKRPGVDRFDVKDVISKSGAGAPDWISVNDKSWGTMNSPIDKYSGNTAIGMTALAIALMLGMIVGIDFLSSILGMMHNDDDKKKPGKGILSIKGDVDPFTNIYELGNFKSPATESTPGFPPLPLDLTAYLGMISTTYPWEKCVKKGMLLFFGSDDSDASFASIGVLSSGDSFKSAASNPGFYSVFIRAVVRSSLVIFDQIKEVVSNLASLSIFDGFSSMLELFDIIKRSKLMSAMNIFAQIGDQALSGVDESIEQSMWNGKKSKSYSYTDSIPNNALRATVMKSRLKYDKYSGITTKLAWASDQAGAIDNNGEKHGTILLFPDSLKVVAGMVGGSNSWIGKYSSFENPEVRSKMQLVSLKDDTGNRIPNEYVEKLESLLDGTYVPFYFHDIRTNEIISFHAFLTSLADQFTPEWNKSNGFGRADGVQTYKSTSRKISLSFIVAATSESDFQNMWIKINKLVTLVYPQYSEGTRLTADGGDTSFIQPFSQMYSAGPLIRIRLGDLLRSNYSKFALARLFGAGSKEFKVKDVGELTSEQLSQVTYSIRDEIRNLSNKVNYQGKTYIITASKLKNLKIEFQTDDGPTRTGIQNDFNTIASSGETFKLKINSIDDDGIANITFTNDNNGIVRGKKGTISSNDIEVDKDEITKAVIDQFDTTSLKTIFDPENNAIVKSFKSAGGRGLAGVINDLSFDFYDNVTWNTDTSNGKNSNYGSQAPKLCKITLSFSPIHDIAPGIDSMGYNRAPVYPVGHPYSREGDKGSNGGSS